MSNALPLSMSNVPVPAAPASRPRPTWVDAPAGRAPLTEASPVASFHASPSPQPLLRFAPPQPRPTPLPPPIPATMPERMIAARERIREAAVAGRRIRSYEVALDLDHSEFHFARQFRMSFGRSPHVYYDEVRADRARCFLRDGLAEREVARRVGFRRPAELRALLIKHGAPASLL